MASSRHREIITEMLSGVDIEIDGDRPWDIQVHNPEFFTRVLAEGSLGLGESYMDGWWDCVGLDEMIHRAIAGAAQEQLPRNLRTIAYHFQARWQNLQTRRQNLKLRNVQ